MSGLPTIRIWELRDTLTDEEVGKLSQICLLRETDGELTPNQIAAKVGLPASRVETILEELGRCGVV